MGRVEQYHTHTRIVDGYKILPIPIPMGIKTLFVPIPDGYPYPLGIQWVDQILHKLLTILILSIVHWGQKTRDFDLLNL
jgi:protein-tyrosine phosphatase